MINKTKERPLEEPYQSEWRILLHEFMEWLGKMEAEVQDEAPNNY